MQRTCKIEIDEDENVNREEVLVGLILIAAFRKLRKTEKKPPDGDLDNEKKEV